MAIVLEANYAKKLGLPGYSSHQYSVSIRTELTDLSNVADESKRLHRLLQDAVDESIKQVGFMPDLHSYGNSAGNSALTNGSNRQANGNNGQSSSNGNAQNGWCCSDKQRDLIEKVVHERSLDKHEVDALAHDMLGAGVVACPHCGCPAPVNYVQSVARNVEAPVHSPAHPPPLPPSNVSPETSGKIPTSKPLRKWEMLAAVGISVLIILFSKLFPGTCSSDTMILPLGGGKWRPVSLPHQEQHGQDPEQLSREERIRKALRGSGH